MLFDIQPFLHCLIFVLSGVTIGFYFGYRREWEEDIVIKCLDNGNYELRCKKVSFDCYKCKNKMTVALDENSTINIGCFYCDPHK